ncbi:FadR/GntR family transcriptional regulator [Cytobacillus sp. FJAT-54145]|uniref:FadR/GntR family transcriptional regulator n=1 Tax=Cytobacillus spartinae TaxID=3299023 RepID=A0ABW6KHS6_9BACI
MNVEKISTKKVSDSVVEQIEKMIESGSFLPGEKLPSVRELCDLFGVGRSAVRDAITTLKGRGAVEVKQGEGTYICEFDSKKIFNNHLLLPSSGDIRELFQVRKVLEPGIAELAALNRSQLDLENLSHILSDKSFNGWESDYNFHLTIAKSTGNEIMVQMVQFISNTLKKAMMDFHQFIQEDEITVASIEKQHRKIFDSITLGDSQRAKESMIEHLDLVEQLLQSSILQKV